MTNFRSAGIFAGAMALLATQAMLAQECGNSDFKGVFGAHASGSFLGTPGIPPGPSVRAGRVEVDGKGKASIKAVLSLGGLILQEEYGGNYTIAPDCTATVTLLIPFPGVPSPIPFKFTGVLSDDGEQQDLILIEPPGTTVRITLRKQRKARCSNSDLAGPYTVNMAGFALFQVGLPPNSEFARVGKIEFDGKGGFTAATRASRGGNLVTEDLGGTYEVAADCTFTMSYRDLFTHTWSGMLTDNSAAGYLINSAPAGAAIAGSIRQVR